MIHSQRLSGSIQQISLRKYHSKEKLSEKVLLINYRIQRAFCLLEVASLVFTAFASSTLEPLVA